MRQREATGDQPDTDHALTYRRLRRDLLAVERAELDRLYETGAISDATRRRIQRVLDLEDASLAADEP
jgi:CPA1 family monovalent cation:H+ antiporter